MPEETMAEEVGRNVRIVLANGDVHIYENATAWIGTGGALTVAPAGSENDGPHTIYGAPGWLMVNIDEHPDPDAVVPAGGRP